MQSLFTRHLHKFFGRYFVTYPVESIDRIYSAFVAAREVFLTDVWAKYERYKSVDLSGETLFELIQTNACLEAVFYYRLERQVFLDDPDDPILPYLSNLMRLKTGVELYYSTQIGPGLNVMHGSGVVVGPRYNIGRNFIINHGATIGQSGSKEPQTITIGDNVRVFSGAKVLGGLCIGDNVHIGANSVLIDDAEPNSVYLGVPARKVRDLSSMSANSQPAPV